MSEAAEREVPGVMLYLDDLEALLPLLTGFEKGELLQAVFNFCENGEEYGGDSGNVKIAFAVLRQKIIRDANSYRARKAQNRENAKKRYTNQSQATANDGNRSQALAANSNSSSNSNSNGNSNGNSNSNSNGSSLSKRKRENSSSSSIDSVFAAAAAAGMNLSDNTINEIKNLVERYGEEAVIAAINRADENSTPNNDKRSTAYIRRCLEGMQNDQQEALEQQKREEERIAAGLPKVDERGIEDWNDG